ncbi:MAG: heparinase II/III family protein, partial [Bacteroidales bacterium]|nr:heparinase II/III family protein [Bacteroidales bacterium]
MSRFLKLAAALLVLCLGLNAAAQQTRTILQKELNTVDTCRISSDGKWFPYPAYSDREGWDRLTGEHRAQIIAVGERYLNYKWQVIPPTAYLAFERTGSRSEMEAIDGANFVALTSLTFAELAEGQGRFIDQIINGMFLMTERTTWIFSAHQVTQKTKRSLPDARDIFIDLCSQRWGLQLALCLHFLRAEFDAVDPSISAAVDRALDRHIFKPYLDKTLYKENHWLGFTLKEGAATNNWSPWCNSNVLLTFLLEDHNRQEVLQAVTQAARSVDIYLDTNKYDGGCDEGPSYWDRAAASVYDYLRVMSDATGGEFDCWDDPQVQAMALYKSRVMIGDGWTVNFGDGSARSMGSIAVLYRFGKDTGVKELSNCSLYMAGLLSPSTFGHVGLDFSDLYRSLETLRYAQSFSEDASEALQKAGGDMDVALAQLREDVPQSTWYPQTEHLFMHNGRGWFLGAKGGHNAESHNHNDVGSCVFFIDNIPVLADAGVGIYTRETFIGKYRYRIWSMQSQWHNLPVINGISQHNGRTYCSKNASFDARKRVFSLDIAGAYTDSTAAKSWARTYTLGTSSLVISDRFELSERHASDVEHFLVQGDVILPGDTTPAGYKV